MDWRWLCSRIINWGLINWMGVVILAAIILAVAVRIFSLAGNPSEPYP